MNKLILYVMIFCLPTVTIFSQTRNIYHDGWIDLNKNGKKDIYEDSKAKVEDRIKNLLSQMNMEEKTAQMVTLYGYGRVLKDSLPTADWKNKSWKDGMGAIDEHLNGFVQWGLPPLDIPICKVPSLHAEAMNKVQRFFIEETRLGIPTDFTNEGIRGIENYIATNFPTQLGIGQTWNRDLVHKIGLITGKEARILGYTNVYSPILDVGRDQRWGRMEEVYGESPYLVAELGIQMAKGLQYKNQVASTAKHFAIYSANKGAREGLARLDPQISPRESENVHLYTFRRVIQEAGILGVMSSYNDYDGIPIQSSPYYLLYKLRQKYGFKGYVVSDSDAVIYLYNKHKTAKDYKEAVLQSVQAGLNVRCTFRSPDTFLKPLRELVNEGAINIDTINKRVADVLRVKFIIGLFDNPYVKNPKEADRIVNSVEHNKVALQASRESIILLKNKDNLLPLNKDNIKTISVCGPNANNADYALTHYGPLAVEVTTVLDGIKNKLSSKANVLYTKGCDIVDENWPDSELYQSELTDKERDMIDKAVENAKKSDVTVVVVGGSQRTCGENKSRTSINLPGRQLDLLKAVYATGKPVIAVVISGRPLSINWTDKNIPAILQAFYPGSKGGEAIADIIFGDYNPGGKLTVTVPKTVGQIPFNFPCKPNAQLDAWGNTGLKGKRARVNGALYPFGYGLSYTNFKYSNLTVSPKIITPGQKVNVSVTVQNTGDVDGDEVVQLYLRDMISSVTTYEKQLRGFERVHLKKGESKIINFVIKPQDMTLLDKDMKRVIEPGEFKVMIGASSVDIILSDIFSVSDNVNKYSDKDKNNKYNVSSFPETKNLLNLVDNNDDTEWKSGNKEVNINFEIPENKKVDKVTIHWGKMKNNKNFKIQLSGGGGQFINVLNGKTKSNATITYEFKGFPATDLRIICPPDIIIKEVGI